MPTKAQRYVSGLALPAMVDFGDGRVVIAETLTAEGEVLIADVVFMRNGVAQPFNNPWKIANPPMTLVPGEGADLADVFKQVVLTSGWFA